MTEAKKEVDVFILHFLSSIASDFLFTYFSQPPGKASPSASFAPECILYYTEISIIFCMFNKSYF